MERRWFLYLAITLKNLEKQNAENFSDGNIKKDEPEKEFIKLQQKSVEEEIKLEATVPEDIKKLVEKKKDWTLKIQNSVLLFEVILTCYLMIS